MKLLRLITTYSGGNEKYKFVTYIRRGGKWFFIKADERMEKKLNELNEKNRLRQVIEEVGIYEYTRR